MTKGGRHRRGRPAWLLPLAVVVALAVGFGAGVVVESSDDGISPAAAAGPSSPSAAPVAALPDPSDAGPVAAYLAALDAAGVPVGANRDVVVAVGRQVCQQPPGRRSDVAGLGMLIAAVFPTLWTPAQGSAIVTAADRTLC